MTQKEILCTLGPSSLNDGVIARLEELGASLFRLNLSHTKVEDLAEIIEYVQSQTSVPLCLDTEGAQVRTNGFVDRVIKLRDSSVVRIKRALVPGDGGSFNLHPINIVDQLAEGDFLKVDSSVLLQVIDVERDGVAARVLAGGEIGQNKAVTVERSIPMPPLTEKDHQALAIGRAMGIRHVALSFASRASDLDEIREASTAGAFVYAKIESRNGLRNLRAITAAADAILIDRGDLSREVPIEQIPRLQKRIIRCGKQAGIKVYVATNLMESMVTQAAPTRAEVNDVYNTLADGADGLVLAAETAVGQYPVGCASMVVKITREFEEESWGTASHMPTPAISLLVDPHGGRLVDRVAQADDIPDLEALPSVVVDNSVLMDCEQIANGTYSPLTGFMCRETLQSVLDKYRLPNGLPWTMPILLQVPRSVAASFGEGDRIALRSDSGDIHAVLDVSEVYSLDLEELFTKWFGTSSPTHPGVARLQADDAVFVGGDILMLRPLASALAQYKLTPAQTRFVFGQTGWNRVVGFHTRNVPHRAHEYIQMRALEMTHADGLLISPVIGSTKVGDFLPDWIMKSYRLMIDFGIYPRDKILLTCFATYPRYSGPREAVFTAICRKNMGCSHFILGRDHTGIGDFYSDAQTRELFAELDDIGITPLFFDVIGYNPQTRAYCPVDDNGTLPISGTEVRRSLSERGTLPGWYVRDNVQQMLLSAIGNGEKILHEDE
jgi:pyruvate kinase